MAGTLSRTWATSRRRPRRSTASRWPARWSTTSSRSPGSAATRRSACARFLRSSYANLLTKDERAIQRGEDALLTDEARTLYEEYNRSHPDAMPNLYERAKEADESFRGEIAAALPESLQVLGFVDLYNKIYTGYADTTTRQRSGSACSCTETLTPRS